MLPKSVHVESAGVWRQAATHWRYARAAVGERNRGGRSVCPPVTVAVSGAAEDQDVGRDVTAEAGRRGLHARWPRPRPFNLVKQRRFEIGEGD